MYLQACVNEGWQESWRLSQLSQGKRWATPWLGPQSVAHKQPFILATTDNSELPINLTPCMSVVCGKKPERTHRDMGRTCKLCTCRQDLNPGHSGFETTVFNVCISKNFYYLCSANIVLGWQHKNQYSKKFAVQVKESD